jgi:selenocysteine lyase/cysteine desulfurase
LSFISLAHLQVESRWFEGVGWGTALEVTTRLGLEGSGGMVRVGPVHYNTLEEIRKFGEGLALISNAATRAYG